MDRTRVAGLEVEHDRRVIADGGGSGNYVTAPQKLTRLARGIHVDVFNGKTPAGRSLLFLFIYFYSIDYTVYLLPSIKHNWPKCAVKGRVSELGVELSPVRSLVDLIKYCYLPYASGLQLWLFDHRRCSPLPLRSRS